jgi:hypothetical protein
MLTFENTRANHLGQTPLPAGDIKVFQRLDRAGSLAYAGADALLYLPKGKKAVLCLGQAARIKVIPRIMEIKKKNLMFDRKGNLTGLDEIQTMEIQVSNFSNSPAQVEIIQTLPVSEFKISQVKIQGRFEKTDQRTIRFFTTLLPQKSSRIQYVATLFKGDRRWKH